jgi:hypothetical protein
MRLLDSNPAQGPDWFHIIDLRCNLDTLSVLLTGVASLLKMYHHTSFANPRLQIISVAKYGNKQRRSFDWHLCMQIEPFLHETVVSHLINLIRKMIPLT